MVSLQRRGALSGSQKASRVIREMVGATFDIASEAAGGSWCERGDSNPHPLRDQILSLARLPIPPLSHDVQFIILTRKRKQNGRGGLTRSGSCVLLLLRPTDGLVEG